MEEVEQLVLLVQSHHLTDGLVVFFLLLQRLETQRRKAWSQQLTHTVCLLDYKASTPVAADADADLYMLHLGVCICGGVPHCSHYPVQYGCPSLSETNTIRILIHYQPSNAFKLHFKQWATQCFPLDDAVLSGRHSVQSDARGKADCAAKSFIFILPLFCNARQKCD